MKRYLVRISPGAWLDLQESLLWGISEWGVEAASEWLGEMQAMIHSSLSASPRRCAMAPEAAGMGDRELRQLIAGRYRVLFTITGQQVLVMHVVGPYAGGSEA
ncbi:MAG TPA: hypothetical protein VGI80_04580, partial [Pyrinomonadaceae bacterium]